MAIGPVQMLVLGFEDPQFSGEILEELERLREADIVRLIDAVTVKKDENGEIGVLRQSDLSGEEAAEFGAVVGALIGLGAAGEEGIEPGAEAGAEAFGEEGAFNADDVWYVTDAIPDGSAAAIALIEHRWAIPLRDAIERAGGVALADEWVHAKDLIAVGLLAAEEAVI